MRGSENFLTKMFIRRCDSLTKASRESFPPQALDIRLTMMAYLLYEPVLRQNYEMCYGDRFLLMSWPSRQKERL